jgi:DNA-binding response OmpR family regulator
MAKILISEPRGDVAKTLARMVSRLGHKPELARVPMPEHFLGVDVYLVETAGDLGVTRVQAARHAAPALPIIGMSAEPPPRELRKLGLELDGWLGKPFTARELDAAIGRVLPRSA